MARKLPNQDLHGATLTAGSVMVLSFTFILFPLALGKVVRE